MGIGVRAVLNGGMGGGIFPEDSMARRVNRENVLMLGGGRALLMQLAHPKVAAGVDEHSDFRARPLYRLRRTIRLTMAIVFGDERTALVAAGAVNRVHARVKGRDYSALDPDLLLWVYATLVDSALLTYETFVGPLRPGERETFYQEMKVAAELLGLPRKRFPESLADFNGYVDSMIATGVVEAGPLARDLAKNVLRPPLRLVPGHAMVPFEIVTAGLLPEALREQYGLKWGRRQERIFRLFVIAVPKLVAVTPPILRVWPLPGRNVRLAPDLSLSA